MRTEAKKLPKYRQLYAEMESSRTTGHVLGLGLGGQVLGLGLEGQVLGLGLGLGRRVLGLGLGKPVAVLGKNIWGASPLIIWEATTAKRNYYRTN